MVNYITKHWQWAGVVLLVVLMYRFIDRQGLIDQIFANLPSREAGILAGVMLGNKEGLTWEMKENFKNTGLMHILVASGSNLMLLGSVLIENLAWLLGRKKTIVGVMALLWGYAGMTGWEAPVIRAVLLLTIYYWAQLLGRKYEWKRGLGLTVIVMIIGDWRILREAGFWMSVLAFIAITNRPKNNPPARRAGNQTMTNSQISMIKNIRNSLLTTMWVSIWIMPIFGLIGGRIALIAPIANALILGLVEAIMVLGWLGILLGGWGLLIVLPVLKWMVITTEGLGGLGWTVSVGFNWWMAVGWYMILFYYLVKNRAK